MDTKKSADSKKTSPIGDAFLAALRIFYFSFVVLSLGVFAGCESSGPDKTAKQVSELARQLNEQLETHSSKLGDLIPSQDQFKKSSIEEIQRVFAVEYLVVELKSDINLGDLQNKLSEMGKERWDCFSQISSQEHLRLLCKRRPISALRTLIGVGGFL